MPIANISEVWIERTYTPPSYMCLSAVARSNKLCIVVTIDQLVGVQRSAVVRCADVLSCVLIVDEDWWNKWINLKKISNSYQSEIVFINN